MITTCMLEVYGLPMHVQLIYEAQKNVTNLKDPVTCLNGKQNIQFPKKNWLVIMLG